MQARRMLAVVDMRWHIYTKLVEIDRGVSLRWFWRNPDRWQESPSGFLSRGDCQADAARYGYTPELEERRRLRITPATERRKQSMARRTALASHV